MDPLISIFDNRPSFCPRCGNELVFDSEPGKEEDKKYTRLLCDSCKTNIYIGPKNDLITTLTYLSTLGGPYKTELIIAHGQSTTQGGIRHRVLKIGDDWEIALIIEPNSPIEDIRENLGEVKTEAILIQKELGSRPDFNHILINEWMELRDRGWTYDQIAEQINFDCLICLLLINDPKSEDKYIQFGIKYFHELLRVARKRNKFIEKSLDEGLQKIDSEELIWTPESGPVNKSSLKYGFRKWREEMMGIKIELLRNKNFYLASFWGLSIGNNYWKKAEDLLRQKYLEPKRLGDIRYVFCSFEIQAWLNSQPTEI